jgi:AcrR family transcriptional regulator
MNGRDKLLEGALACIEERGFARTTARDLVEASDTHLASIGYHWGSTEQLLNVAVAEGFRLWLRHFLELASEGKQRTPWARLQRMASELPVTFADNRGLALAFAEACSQAARSESVRAEMAAGYAAAREDLAAVIEELLGDEAPISHEDAINIASLLSAIFDGLLLQWLVDADTTPSGAGILASLGRALPAALAGGIDAGNN